MDHRPHHHPVLLLRRRLGRLRLRVQQRLQQWLWLQQRLRLQQWLRRMRLLLILSLRRKADPAMRKAAPTKGRAARFRGKMGEAAIVCRQIRW